MYIAIPQSSLDVKLSHEMTVATCFMYIKHTASVLDGPINSENCAITKTLGDGDSKDIACDECSASDDREMQWVQIRQEVMYGVFRDPPQRLCHACIHEHGPCLQESSHRYRFTLNFVHIAYNIADRFRR